MPAIPVQDCYILLSRLGLGINFIQWVPLRSYKNYDAQFVAVALFVVYTGRGGEVPGRPWRVHAYHHILKKF